MSRSVYCAAAAVLVAAGVASGVSPSSELAAVSEIADQHPGAVFLTMYCVPPGEREALFAAVAYVLNATSDTGVLSPPIQLTDTLLLVEPQNYCASSDRLEGWNRAWEAISSGDHTWGFATQVQVDGKVQLKRVPGGWLDLKQVASIQSVTGRSQALLRADEFVAVASRTTAGGAYYQLAGIPETLERWFVSHGVDVATVNRVRAKRGANVLSSGVTFKPRRVYRMQGSLGGSYFTLDSAEVSAARDPIRYAVQADGSLNLEYDAGEYIAVGQNGLLRFALYDATGKRQDSVPQEIAIDPQDLQGVLQPMISCVRCHVESGLRPVDTDQAELAERGVRMLSSDPAVIQRAMEFYSPARLSRGMDFDRETYATAVRRLTGLSPEQLAGTMSEVYRNFVYLPVGLDVAARELGVSIERAEEVLSRSQDPILLALVARKVVSREQWASSFAEAAVAVAQ